MLLPLLLCFSSFLAPDDARIELVESWPAGTTLDHADIPDAADVWLDMIGKARQTLDFAEFYVVDQAPSRLTKIVEALEAAGARGVAIRFVVDKNFRGTSEETLARIAKIPKAQVRRIDYKALAGGILHAKYFLADGADVFLGSQNFDWRSLEHIQELGVRIHSAEIAAQFRVPFEEDWAAAGGSAPAKNPAQEPLVAVRAHCGDEDVQVTPVWSPEELSSHGELAPILRSLDQAKKSVRVQLLTYKMVGRDKVYFAELENALRRAAARGVKVQLLVADWCKRKGTIEGLQALEPLENVEVKLVTIPPAAAGFIPYGRVIHAKYMVVDGAQCWIGTSNWERDYFHESRNVGVLVEGAHFAQRLERFFDDGWNAPYASEVDPSAKYTPPKIGD